MSKMRHWDALGKTDPAHTKSFKRAGGFSGTALKPMWAWQRLTEYFGPCGTGWGMEQPTFQVVQGDNSEVLVYCTVLGWYLGNAGESMSVFGVGGDKVVTHIKANEQYKRPERWENDDEAFKKAYTDALMNAFKFVGVGADVHMGRFDDNKYVQQMEREFAPPLEPRTGKPAPLQGPIKTRAALRIACGTFKDELDACEDEAMLTAFLAMPETKALMDQVRDEAPRWWEGDGMEFIGMEKEVGRRKALIAMDAGPHTIRDVDGNPVPITAGG